MRSKCCDSNAWSMAGLDRQAMPRRPNAAWPFTAKRQGISVDGEIMRTLRKTAFLLLFTLAATGALAQARGEGRVSGKVVDDKGQPLQDVQVKATMTGQPLPVQTKSNKKGEWTINGIAGGEWNLEFSKDGFDPQNGKVTVDENSRMGDITVKLAKHTEKVDPGAPHGPGFDMPLIDVEGYMPARPMDVLKDAHVFTADHPEVASYVPCYCGCGNSGHKNNADCFVKGRDPEGRVTEWEPHGVSCAVCIDIAVESMKMRNSGASVMAIRKKVQSDYRARFASSETPTPAPVQGK
jgi:hypothetical protein